MDIICIKACEANYLNRKHFFKEGEHYKYNYAVYRNVNFIYTDKNTVGYVTNEFIKENFITKENFNKTLNDVDMLFDHHLNGARLKDLQQKVKDLD